MNTLLGGHYSPENNVRGDTFGGDTFGGDNIHYYTGSAGGLTVKVTKSEKCTSDR